MIEIEWYCFGGDTTTRDVCLLLPSPKVDSIVVDLDNSIATITLNDTVLLNTKWNTTMFNVYV